jgi:ribosomal-protein-alanine N-acetyltransferase
VYIKWHKMANGLGTHLTTDLHRDKNAAIMKAREAHLRDWPAIEALINRARYTSPPLWRWKEHLPDEGFIVVESGTCGEGSQANRIQGALLASSDASPVAWIRLAAVDDDLDIGHWLDLSLPTILSVLDKRGIRELAWMDYGDWAHVHLTTRGFTTLADVVTLTKTDHHLPDSPIISVAETDAPGVTLRPATHVDLAAIALIDQAAFEPHWWRSEATVRRRAATASQFTVAEYRGEVLGYAERELHLPTAHLNRIAIHPRIQGRHVGAALLRNVLHTLWQSGARTVSLNTQRHNHRSRRLYEYFGFKPTGEVVTVWTLRPITPRPSAGTFGHRRT